jgi:phosphoribosyl 1,2-cyclic phosphodiesterase
LKVCVLGSGSSGNCTVMWTETEALLIDCGRLSHRYVIQQLADVEIPPSRIKGILVTHAHGDHIGRTAIRMAREHNIPVFLHRKIYGDLVSGPVECGIEQLHERDLIRFHPASGFTVGEFEIEPFKTHHKMGSVSMSLGFCILHNGIKISYMTDCGKIDDKIVKAMSGSHIAVIEANHHVEMVKNGPRPWKVKKWVLSDDGHLSNDAAAELIKRLSGPNSPLRHVFLAHISEDHNILEELAEYVAQLIGDSTVKLSVTYHHARSEVISAAYASREKKVYQPVLL